MNFSSKNAAFLAILIAGVVAVNAVTFGSDPQPVIQEIEVHDVTDFQGENRTNKTNLVDSISPSNSDDVLNLSNSEDDQQFRYDFKIKNEGDKEWNISQSDELFHEGIDVDNWTVNESTGAFYQIEAGKLRKGAEIVQERLEWNTSNEGTLESGQNMNASYIFEPNLSQNENYNQTFRAENTDQSSGSEYNHNTSIILRDPGFLNVTMHEPPEDSRLQLNRTFEVNSTVECLDGECGDVDLSVRYNNSGDNLKVPETESEPFYTIGSNPKTCQDMTDGSSCTFNWDVNATGDIGSNYVIDTEANSPISEVDNNQSEGSNVSIDYFLIVSDNRENTTFGAIDPNTTYNPAEGNQERPVHEISVDSYSQPVDELFMQVDNLTSYFIDGYHIGPSNLSYNFVNKTSNSTRATGDADVIKTDIQPGSTVEMFYWLDVPSGVVQDYYNGTIEFAAGSSP